jgi:hypothetical protein
MLWCYSRGYFSMLTAAPIWQFPQIGSLSENLDDQEKWYFVLWGLRIELVLHAAFKVLA